MQLSYFHFIELIVVLNLYIHGAWEGLEKKTGQNE